MDDPDFPNDQVSQPTKLFASFPTWPLTHHLHAPSLETLSP